MPSHSLSVKEIEKTIKNLDFAKQKQLLKDLPELIKLSPLDPNFLKLAESSFSFWDNQEDAIYDKLQTRRYHPRPFPLYQYLLRINHRNKTIYPLP